MIKLKHIKKIYQTKKRKVTALNKIDLEVHQGEIFGIIGYSGAGKSTLIRLINLLEKPTEGEIWVNNQRIDLLTAGDLRKARQQIGMIFQHFNLLWSRSVKGNIALPLEIAGVPKEEIDVRVEELMDLVGLTDLKEVYPSELSGGQKQRVGIARALANRPTVLLSDEATSALDPNTTDSILELLKDINKRLGITIVLITHEMHVIQKICDKVAIISEGETIETGPVLDVFTHPKEQITKDFVKQVFPYHREKHIAEGIKDNTKQLIKCNFMNESANQPIISRWMKTFDIEVNILEGTIERVQDAIYGTLYIEINADQQNLIASIEYLENVGVEVEVINYA